MCLKIGGNKTWKSNRNKYLSAGTRRVSDFKDFLITIYKQGLTYFAYKLECMKQLPFFSLLLLTFIIGSCGSLKEPDFIGIENVKTTGISLSQTSLFMDLHYFNPNKSKLKLKKADGDAWIDGNLLGRFMLDTLIIIPANADFRLPVKLELNMKNVLKNSMSAFLKKEVLLKIVGTAKVGKAGFYVNYPVRYEGKQNLNGLLQ